MQLVCLDFEGVLVPDIWPYVAEQTGIDDLKFTTRDFKDYRELMNKRVDVCFQNKISLNDILAYIDQMSPCEGAPEFVEWIRSKYQFIILSDTFYEFVPHFMQALGRPTLFCHSITYNNESEKLEFDLRQEDQKTSAVKAFRSLNIKVYAAGDSYNDTGMLGSAHHANLYQAPQSVIDEFPQYKNILDFEGLKECIVEAFD